MTTTDPVAAAIERLLHTIAEEHPVRKARQRVVQCLVAKVLLERLSLGDVVRVDDDAVHRGIGGQVRHGEIEGAPLAAASRHSQLGAMRHRRVGRQAEQQCRQGKAIVRMHEARQFVADEFVRLVAEHAGHRCADVVDEAVVVDDGDDIRSVLDQTAEPRLTGRELQLRRFAVVDLARRHDDAVDLGIAAHVGDDDLEPVRGAVGRFEADLAGCGSGRRGGDQFAELCPLLRNGQVDDRCRTQVVIAESEQP